MFLYSILAILKYDEVVRQYRNRTSSYNLSDLIYNPLDLPMKLKDIRKFEAKNPGLIIIVFSYDNSKQLTDSYVLKHPHLDILHRSKVLNGTVINLLLLNKGNNFHYVAISNLNRLLNCHINTTCPTRIQSLWCHRCLNGFKNRNALEKHEILCK